MKNYDEELLKMLNDETREIILKIIKDYLKRLES